MFKFFRATQGYASFSLSFFVCSTLLATTVTEQAFGGILSHHCLDRQEIYGASTTIHVGASVEPTIAVNPKDKNEIVACWQQDRISNLGALEIGINYSKNGGKTWHKSKVPFQVSEGGISQRVSEPWLSFAADGSRLYLSALVINATTDINTQNQEGVVVTTSEDGGETWSNIRFVGSSQTSLNEPTGQFAVDDKATVTADPIDPDFAYIVWDRFNQEISAHSTTQISRTTDGAKTWSSHQLLYDPFPDLTAHNLSNGIENDCLTINNIILRQPKVKAKSKQWQEDNWSDKHKRLKGDLLNFMVRQYARPGATNEQYLNDRFPFQYSVFDIALVRSKDQGKTWNTNATVIVPANTDNLIYTGGYTYNGQNQIIGGLGTLLRADEIVPSYAVNPKNGFLYVAFETGEFRSDQLPQIGLTTSRDGGHTWSKPAKVSRTPKHCSNPQAFIPFVAVTKDGQVGILYFDMRHSKISKPSHTKIDAWFVAYEEVEHTNGGSTGIGLDFVNEIRLSEKSYIAQNGPTTTQGVMVDGDYPFLVTHDDHFYAIYTKSFKGPFKKIKPFYTDVANQAIIYLDNNYRQAPFVSIIKSSKKRKASLISTTKMRSITPGTNVN